MRLWRPEVPGEDPSTLLETRAVDTPTGIRFDVKVGWVEVAPGRGEGFVLAFGARPRRCVALAFFTAFEGSLEDGAVRDAVVDRLGTVEARVVPSIVVLDAEARIEPPREVGERLEGPRRSR